MTQRELPLVQRGIVDNCFEEGHYEYGIDVLDKLRAVRYKPSILHMRQLLYISLYPPPPKPLKRLNRTDAPPPSPQKVQLQRQKDDLWPKPASRPLAIALLEAITRMNTPAVLMRGLPFYSYVDNEGVMDVDPFQGEIIKDDHSEDNSPLNKEILAMQQIKDCWELLRDNLVKRKQVDRHRVEDAGVDLGAEEYSVVGPYAWPVLEWLVSVFEKDESRAIADGQAPHSALLLCQIPAPRSKKGPRWDAETPLRVAFMCFSSGRHVFDRPHKYASSDMRINLGVRLMSLLVNLTLTKPPLLSPSHLLRSSGLRLQDLPLPALQAFLSGFSLSHASFKLALLESYISQGSGSNTNNARPTGFLPVASPRVKPKFTGKLREDTSSIMTRSPQDKDKNPYPTPAPDGLLQLISSPLPLPGSPGSHDAALGSPPLLPFSSASKLAFAKLHLISNLYTLQLSRHFTDTRWTTVVREGMLRNYVRKGFAVQAKSDDTVTEGASEVKAYTTSALEMVSIWEASVRM